VTAAGSYEQPELVRALAARLEKPLVILAVGNELRGDDGFGPLAAGLLAAARPLEGVEIVQGGSAPEAYAERIARISPRTVLVLDACRYGGRPGELRLLEPRELGWMLGGGTHAPSLELLATYLDGRCGSRLALLAAEPLSTAIGAPVSPELRRSAELAAEALRAALGG